jgi:hypothetical protein
MFYGKLIPLTAIKPKEIWKVVWGFARSQRRGGENKDDEENLTVEPPTTEPCRLTAD